MSKQKFVPEPMACHGWGGASMGILCPGDVAVRAGLAFHGAWLAAYMIRRFGPPNHGSDPHKQLCSWTLSTPEPRLALVVTPYLADDGGMATREKWPMCLHFGYRLTRSLERQLWRADPLRRRFRVTLQKAYRWAKRTSTVIEGETITRRKLRGNIALCRMLVEAYRQRYPRTSNRWHDSRIAYLCHCALQTTIRVLAEPVMVRDVRFSPVGPLDDFGPHCEPFDRAGWPCRVDD
jgi:hypothetical protein